jgi:hypothetical protein
MRCIWPAGLDVVYASRPLILPGSYFCIPASILPFAPVERVFAPFQLAVGQKPKNLGLVGASNLFLDDGYSDPPESAVFGVTVGHVGSLRALSAHDHSELAAQEDELPSNSYSDSQDISNVPRKTGGPVRARNADLYRVNFVGGLGTLFGSGSAEPLMISSPATEILIG